MLVRSRDDQESFQEALQCGSCELPAIASNLSICLQVAAGLRGNAVVLFQTCLFLKYVIQYVILTERPVCTYDG